MTITPDQIDGASAIGKEILTAADADAVKEALDIEDTKAVWGQITGDLADQTDVIDALDSKANAADLDSKADKSQLPQEGTVGHFVSVAGADGSMQDSGVSPDDFATAAQGALAETAIQPAGIADFTTKTYVDNADANLQGQIDNKANSSVTVTGTGSLTGGGALTANRTIDASPATKASLALADTAIQQAALDSATKSKAEITALTPIADPATATIEDVATAYNNLLAALTA